MLAIFVLGLLGAGGAYLLSCQPPSWWRSIDLSDPMLAQRGQAVENDLTTELSRVRAGASPAARAQSWQISIDTTAANAWLNTRLASWAESRGDVKPGSWPREIREVQVDFDDGLVRLAVRLEVGGGGGTGGRERVLTADLRPQVRDDGTLWMEAQSVALGRLPLPASWVIGLARGEGPVALPATISGSAGVQHVARALAGEGPLMTQAQFKLPDGRRVRMLNLEPRGGKLIVTCTTAE